MLLGRRIGMVPSEKSLLQVLSNNDVVFFIPPYQRNYEWTNEQCDVFFHDVLKTAQQNDNQNKPKHFFGFITFVQIATPFVEPDKLVLVDGQQRITTTMLFLVALRDLIDDENLKKYIETKFLKNNNAINDSEYRIKLKQVETDWESYKKVILGEELTPVEKNSAIAHNYTFFLNKLKQLLQEGYDIKGLLDKGLARFDVITVELQPSINKWENPQEIFESMNSLGKPLSFADLVRNYLLLGMEPDKQTELYKDYWLHIEQELGENISNYIRDYMQYFKKAAFKKATESNYKELYRQFKEKFAGIDAEEILKCLCEASDLYSYLLPNHMVGIDIIDKVLNDLKVMRVTTAYSFLLAILIEWRKQKFTDQDVADIFDAFRIYIMRRRILKITQAENKVFPQFVNRVSELIEAPNKREKMFDILAHQENNLRLPNDVEIKAYLESANFYNFQYCKFYLAMIEEKITRSRPDITETVLQIEHIMPQTLNNQWRMDLGDNADTIHQQYVNNIGNLTLIRYNQELGQKPFSEKKQTYNDKSGLQIARTDIIDCEVWDKNSILRRARWLIGQLLREVLPIPKEMRKTNNFSMNKKRHPLSFNELQLYDEIISFIPDPTIVAKVIDDKHVEFEGRLWKLTPLTKELLERRGQCNNSGNYPGSQYWQYEDVRLADIL